MDAKISIGGVFGLPVMKFTLHYDGPLPSSGNKAKNKEKWEIRSKLHPQFADLWTSHPALRVVEDNRHFPKTGGTTLTQVHHLHPGPIAPLRGGILLEAYLRIGKSSIYASLSACMERGFDRLCGNPMPCIAVSGFVF
jgi:hypothetical protein